MFGISRRFWYLEMVKSDGSKMLYGPLKKGNEPCRNEQEARDAAFSLAKGNLFDLRQSKHSTIAAATQELKGNVFERTGNPDKSTKRIGHQIQENQNNKGTLEHQL